MSEAPNPTPAPEPTPAPTPAPTPTPTPIPNSNDAPPAAYYEAFANADLKTNPAIHKFKTVEDLANGYVAAERRLGADPKTLISLPKGPDDKEGSAALYKALGAPETADGYQISMEGASEADVAAAKAFAVAMHAEGPFPPQFVVAATKWFSETVAQQNAAELEAAAAATAAGEAEVKSAWGQAYEPRQAEVGKLINDLGGPELVAELNASTFGDNPKLTIFLGKILDKMAEPGPRNEGGLKPGDKLTPAAAIGKAREMEAHPAFLDAANPQHAEVVKSRNDYLRMAQPGA